MFGLSRAVEIALGLASVAMFVAMLVAVPMFLVRVPDDYFARPRSVCSFRVRIIEAVVGVVLVVLGLAMLVLPGQGVLTILVGLSILNLPMKDRMIRRLLGHPKVLHAVNSMRHKAGKGSLVVPGDATVSAPA